MWRHQTVFGIIPGQNSSSLIFCLIWLKHGTGVNFEALSSNLNQKVRYECVLSEKKTIFLTKNWKPRPNAPWQKCCHGNTLVYCRLKTFSNDGLFNYTTSQKVSSAYCKLFWHSRAKILYGEEQWIAWTGLKSQHLPFDLHHKPDISLLKLIGRDIDKVYSICRKRKKLWKNTPFGWRIQPLSHW